MCASPPSNTRFFPSVQFTKLSLFLLLLLLTKTYCHFIFGRCFLLVLSTASAPRDMKKKSAECLKSQNITSNSIVSHNPFSYSLSSFFCDGRQLLHSEVLSPTENKTCHKTPTAFLHITYPKQQHRRLQVTETEVQGARLPPRALVDCLETETTVRNKVTVCVAGGDKSSTLQTESVRRGFGCHKRAEHLSGHEEYSTAAFVAKTARARGRGSER